eukprot:COSAG05_NODE_1369_length_5056_cov_10.909623_3_plen_62_part_00
MRMTSAKTMSVDCSHGAHGAYLRCCSLQVMINDAWLCGMGNPGHDLNGTFSETIGIQINGK